MVWEDDWVDLLNTYLSDAAMSIDRLAGLTRISRGTLNSWRQGQVKKPRHWQDLLKIAAALEISAPKTDALLTAAGQPPLDILNQMQLVAADRARLKPWQKEAELTPAVTVANRPTATPASAPPPFEAPPRTPLHIKRPQLEGELLNLLTQPHASTVVVWGNGGIGKTTLVTLVAHRLAPQFPDGVFWLLNSGDNTLAAWLKQIANRFDLPFDAHDPLTQIPSLRAKLAKRRALLILDDVAVCDKLDMLQIGGETTRVICTTRDNTVANLLHAPLVSVTEMSEAESLALLACWVAYEPIHKTLVNYLGGYPLALSLAGAQLRAGLPLPALLKSLERLTLLDMPGAQSRTESLTLCFDLSYERLPPPIRRRLAQLGYFKRRYLDIETMQAVWDCDLFEAWETVKHLLRFALLNKEGHTYHLHQLLHQYARQKLTNLPKAASSIAERHARWHIYHHLAHPALAAGGEETREISEPFEGIWADILAGITWAATAQPDLLFTGLLLAHTERPTLLLAGGDILEAGLKTYLTTSNSSVNAMLNEREQALSEEFLGAWHFLRGDISPGIAHFQRARTIWQGQDNLWRGLQLDLRVAGGYLLLTDLPGATTLARQVQSDLLALFPVSQNTLPQAERLFFWFNIIYTPLIRWADLPEADLQHLIAVTEESNQLALQARAIYLYRLWCTTNDIPRPPDVRQRGRTLAVQEARLWCAAGRFDRADDAVSLTNYLLTKRYSRRTARRFARRRAQSTPDITLSQTPRLNHQAEQWWFTASEAQRVAWLSWMLPRYLAARNRPRQPATGQQLPPLKPNEQAYQWVKQILSLSSLGSGGRQLADVQPPSRHFLNGPEWRALSGQRVLPVIDPQVQDLIEQRWDSGFGI